MNYIGSKYRLSPWIKSEITANFTKNKNAHVVYKKDSNQLIKEISGDILYLDPPYNQR